MMPYLEYIPLAKQFDRSIGNSFQCYAKHMAICNVHLAKDDYIGFLFCLIINIDKQIEGFICLLRAWKIDWIAFFQTTGLILNIFYSILLSLAIGNLASIVISILGWLCKDSNCNRRQIDPRIYLL
ncbi:MAG: hypothetical protein MHMPM18_001333 [Marteilia pararefringens]